LSFFAPFTPFAVFTDLANLDPVDLTGFDLEDFGVLCPFADFNTAAGNEEGNEEGNKKGPADGNEDVVGEDVHPTHSSTVHSLFVNIFCTFFPFKFHLHIFCSNCVASSNIY